MPVTSGFTTFGIIRKRMADLYSDFALRIKENGSFGTQTTADLPDTFPNDPLVQLMATTTASTHELWEAVELWYSQLDVRTATGVYLENMHGQRVGIARALGQSDADYRAVLLAAVAAPTRTDLVTIATARPDIDCAILLTSSAVNPIENVPVPGNALIVKGCPAGVNYNALTEAIYNTVDLGVHQFYGEMQGSYQTPNGGCITYNYMEAKPIFAGVEIKGFFIDVCGTVQTTAAIKASIVAALNLYFASCAIGQSVSTSAVMAALSGLSGFVVTDVNLARRPRQLWGNGCDATTATKVMICGKEVVWATSIVCGADQGEVWCNPITNCLAVKPWEFVMFDAQFISIVDDPTRGGCV